MSCLPSIPTPFTHIPHKPLSALTCRPTPWLGSLQSCPVRPSSLTSHVWSWRRSKAYLTIMEAGQRDTQPKFPDSNPETYSKAATCIVARHSPQCLQCIVPAGSLKPCHRGPVFTSFHNWSQTNVFPRSPTGRPSKPCFCLPSLPGPTLWI